MNTKKTILCAAIRFKDKVYTGPNHGTIGLNGAKYLPVRIGNHVDYLEWHGEYHPDIPFKNLCGVGEQGFIASTGEFVNRYEAAEIALESGQIEKLRYMKYELDSSDLKDTQNENNSSV